MVISALTDPFSFVGLIPFALCLVVSLLTVRMVKPLVWHCACSYYVDMLKRYVKIIFTVGLFVCILGVWIVFYKSATSRQQAYLPFVLFIVVFIFKKTLLSLTDPYPFEIAMLISGFWIENLFNTFQVCAELVLLACLFVCLLAFAVYSLSSLPFSFIFFFFAPTF